MKVGEVCLLTNDVIRLSNFYKILFDIDNGSDDNNHQFIISEDTTLTVYNDGIEREANSVLLLQLMMEMYAAYAQAEMEKRQKRQREGIETMKLRGEWEKHGRPKVLSIEEFKEQYTRVIQKEITATKLMKELNISDTTYYRYKKELEKGK